MNYWADGGLRHICVTDEDGNVYLENITGTNNENEYRAMIKALKLAQKGDTIFADSQLIVNQLTKNWKVHAVHLLPFYSEAMKLKSGINIEWVPRDENRAGWILEGMVGNYKKEKFELLR